MLTFYFWTETFDRFCSKLGIRFGQGYWRALWGVAERSTHNLQGRPWGKGNNCSPITHQSFNLKRVSGKAAIDDVEGCKRGPGNTFSNGCNPEGDGDHDHRNPSEDWEGISYSRYGLNQISQHIQPRFVQEIKRSYSQIASLRGDRLPNYRCFFFF